MFTTIEFLNPTSCFEAYCAWQLDHQLPKTSNFKHNNLYIYIQSLHVYNESMPILLVILRSVYMTKKLLNERSYIRDFGSILVHYLKFKLCKNDSWNYKRVKSLIQLLKVNKHFLECWKGNESVGLIMGLVALDIDR